MIFTKNRILGTACLLIFVVIAAFSVTEGVPQMIMFLILGLFMTVASVFIISSTFPKDDDSYWLVLIPFTIIMIFEKIILRWDVLLPFFMVSFAAMYMKAAAGIKPHSNKKKLTISVIIPLFGTIASFILFICISGFVGVFA